MLRLAEASIISTTVQGMLYGIVVFMFLLTMFILRERRRTRVNKGMVAASCALILLATAEFAVNIARLIKGFIKTGPNYPSGVEGCFSDVTEVTFIVKAATIGMNRAFITASVEPENVFAPQTGRWITATYSTTLATNIMATSLLAYRIWSVRRKTAESVASKRLTPILVVVIESGAIYSMTIIAALVAFVVNSVGVYVILDLISPIISIVFNMIIVRIGFASDGRLSVGGLESTRQNIVSSMALSGGRREAELEMKSVSVDLAQFQYFGGDSSAFSDVKANNGLEIKIEPR
ncbi:hypothetical protein EUX98_g1985 [Antrodiella citrinella]|uniref:Uncharacterized protein n=1 Tax=Antrodiella citrinella TaxID=2447956 RepID=A0A4S4N8F8_9APHY|nr:hypothetical protein EUX98_g1985 [Antrodiella citrinella]